jgi:Fe-S cluster assembly scaffold protein SufB
MLLSSLLSQEQKKDLSHVIFSYTVQENTSLELVNDLLEHASVPKITHEILVTLEAHACLRYRQVIREHAQQVLVYNKKFSVILAGERANAQVTMGYCLTGKQTCTVETEQRHEANATNSALSLRIALYDQAHVNNSSMVFVAKSCRDITTKQENKNLMLSPEARVITKPEIDIRSSRVSCCHGATTSSINQEHTWYLKSRGIQEKDARNLIIDGFLGFCT